MNTTFILVVSIFIVVGVAGFFRLKRHVALLKNGDRIVAKIVSVEKKRRKTDDDRLGSDYTYIFNIVYSYSDQGFADTVLMSQSSVRTYLPQLFDIEGLQVGRGAVVVDNEELPIIVDKEDATKFTVNHDQLLAKAHPEHYDANYDEWKMKAEQEQENGGGSSSPAPDTSNDSSNDPNANPYF